MPSIKNRARFCALLLGIIFLAAQFHFCADLNSGPSGPHLCPLCSTAGLAVTTRLPSISPPPVVNRLELRPTIPSFSVEVASGLSPRAPPSL